MWSSGGDDNRVNRISSSSFIVSNPRRNKTLEDVWKDINLTSLHDKSTTRDENGVEELGALLPPPTTTTTTSTTTTTFLGMKLQDFLAPPPFSKETTPPPPTTTTKAPPPLPPQRRNLCLNSEPDFAYCFDNMNNDVDNPLPSYPRLNNHHSDDIGASFVTNSPFDPFGLCTSSSSLSSLGNKKRVSDNDDSSGDRRHKRMIKNRESAARSRARKQAYTNELELEVANLMEENAKLMKQNKQLRLAATAQRLPKKMNLQRTSTAPF